MFKSPLDLRVYKRGEWVVLDPLVWDDGKFQLEVEKGFITDLASTGWLKIFPWFDPDGDSRAPATGHDWLYCSHRCKDRAAADEFLRVALISVGFSEAVARMYWLGVRAWGWKYWNKRRKQAPGLQKLEDFVQVGYEF